jgi:hypothetical protein
LYMLLKMDKMELPLQEKKLLLKMKITPDNG